MMDVCSSIDKSPLPVLCDYWPDTVMSATCVADNLVLNEWETEAGLAGLNQAELESLLRGHLTKQLDGAVHTEVDLTLREVAAKDAGLCGMATMYRLALAS